MRAELRPWDVSLSMVAVAGVVSAWAFGIDASITGLVVLVYVPLALATRTIAFVRRELATGFVRRPLDPAYRVALVQLAVRWTLLFAWALVLRMTVVPAELGASKVVTMSLLYGAVFVAAVVQLIPRRRVFIASNVACALVALFWGVQCLAAMAFADRANAVVLDPPFRTEMLVLQGGLGPLVNRHAFIVAERYAIDMTLLEQDEIHRDSATELGSYACFGSAVHAPADGTIVRVVTTRSDVPIGAVESAHPAGNYLVLEIAAERFLVLAHLERGSITVRAGDPVRCGEVVGRCGNSGSTSAPHLHVQVQDKPDLYADDGRTFPIVFRNVTRGGGASLGQVLDVRRGDRLVAADGACR